MFERLVANRFPLRLTTNGRVQYEATKVEQKKLDDALFRPPAGFKKMTAP
jgi:hypothetical protein